LEARVVAEGVVVWVYFEITDTFALLEGFLQPFNLLALPGTSLSLRKSLRAEFQGFKPTGENNRSIPKLSG